MTTPAHQPGELLSLSEAAKALGVSKPTIYRMKERRELTIIKVGGRYKVAKTEIESYFTRRTQPAAKSEREG